MQDADPAFLF